jgi:hypothetical protein
MSTVESEVLVAQTVLHLLLIVAVYFTWRGLRWLKSPQILCP